MRDSKCIPTGWQILGRGNAYEFSKSFANLIYGMFCRLFVSAVQSDLLYVIMVTPVINLWKDYMMMKLQSIDL